MSHRRAGARMDAAAAGLTGLKALHVVMLEALPLDTQRDLEAQIEISFWGRALGTTELRDLQHSEFDRLCGPGTPPIARPPCWSGCWKASPPNPA